MEFLIGIVTGVGISLVVYIRWVDKTYPWNTK